MKRAGGTGGLSSLPTRARVSSYGIGREEGAKIVFENRISRVKNDTSL